MDNDIDKFNLLVNRFNVHFLDKEKNNLLHYACLAGNVIFVERLLSLGVGVNQKNKGGQTPLITTLIVKPPNTYPIIDLLTKQKVDLNIKDYQSKDALNYACETGDIFILDSFFKMGIPAEKISYHTFSSAMKGCLANSLNKLQTIEVLDTFLSNGFDVNFVNSNNHGLLYYFLLTHQIELFKYCLTRGANIFIVDSKGQDVLDFTISLHNTVNFYNLCF